MMNNSYVSIELGFDSAREEVLIFLSIISVIFGILIIVSKNPIISVLFLISLFLSISFYLMFLGFYFIGISYILVYIGAVSILFLFILMLINVRVSELLSETFNSLILSIIIALSFSVSINQNIPNSLSNYTYTDYYKPYKINESIPVDLVSENIYDLNKYNRDIVHISSESWDNNLTDDSHIISIGNVLYTNYSIWLILTSIILLLSMVGCILITIRRE